MALNLTTAKTFRQFAAIEGVNHPPVHPAFIHASPEGDAIRPDSSNVFTANPATDLLATIGHGLAADTPLRFTTTATLPAGLATVTTYYVISSGLTADAFKVSAAVGGSAVNITDAGTGVHSWARYLTADEQGQIDLWKQQSHLDANVTLPNAILMLNAWKAYETNPKHIAWTIDDALQRHWQWLWRSADHADAAAAASPPSASDTGDIPDPPPPSPADRSPN